MLLALGSKNKQGFLDGTTVKPSANSPKLQQWTRCDNMVRCWLLNSMVNGIKEGFLSAKSAKLLWSEIKERYGQSNGPLLFQLKKELRNITQENQCVAEYFTSLKRYWDDIEDLEEIPDSSCGVLAGCTCNILKKILEAAFREKVLTFLMGLNDCYENLRTNILSMEPMPGINKVYSMVQQIESQKMITNILSTNQESSALVVNKQGDVANSWNNWRKDGRDFKKARVDDRFCHHCNKEDILRIGVSSCILNFYSRCKQQKSRLAPAGHMFAHQVQTLVEKDPLPSVILHKCRRLCGDGIVGDGNGALLLTSVVQPMAKSIFAIGCYKEPMAKMLFAIGCLLGTDGNTIFMPSVVIRK
ncbi:hypothetical protein RND81_09G019100 [Saponaria officinalis]|uniref:Retrotransposon Copia-like N-terminal domain-containing protein n=1 Tax=Saponaria officinalis TaxID=3572 RepID=A0AAW1IHQ2_SAPOF